MKGVVTNLVAERGFAIIEADDQASYFAHCTQLVDYPNRQIADLRVGQEVAFKPGDRNGRLAAFEVEVKDHAV